MFLATSYVVAKEVFDERTELQSKALDAALEKFFPLSPDQIQLIYKAYEQKLEASSMPYTPVPVAVTATRSIALAPGSEIPLVRLSKGYISSVLFLDKTGQPWPIANYSLGNNEAFDVQWDTQSNTLFIQSMKSWAFANMGIRLQGLNTPIMVNLVSSQGEVDYRIDFTVPESGPLAGDFASLYDQNYLDNKLMAFLDGAPPSSAFSLYLEPDIG